MCTHGSNGAAGWNKNVTNAVRKRLGSRKLRVVKRVFINDATAPVVMKKNDLIIIPTTPKTQINSTRIIKRTNQLDCRLRDTNDITKASSILPSRKQNDIVFGVCAFRYLWWFKSQVGQCHSVDRHTNEESDLAQR